MTERGAHTTERHQLSPTGETSVRHLTRALRAIGSKAGVTAVAATLAVGGVATAQTGEATPEPPPAETEDDDADEDDAADEDDETGTSDDDPDEGDDDGTTDDDDDADDDDDESDEADEADEVGESDEDVDDPATDGSDGEVEDADDAAEDRPTEETGREGRGSATSERVHEALTLDGELRPGDEGWGAAVSESARAGGHGQRVSRAARGEEAPPAPAPAYAADAAGGGEDAAGPPAGAPGRSGEAPGRARGGR
jgi:hypothetical protein